jgi:hypothetical protein
MKSSSPLYKEDKNYPTNLKRKRKRKRKKKKKKKKNIL